MFSDGENSELIPAFPAQPKDTTGAGDAFNGAPAAQLANQVPLADAVRFAAAYASVCVERAGAAGSMPSYEEALERQQAFA